MSRTVGKGLSLSSVNSNHSPVILSLRKSCEKTTKTRSKNEIEVLCGFDTALHVAPAAQAARDRKTCPAESLYNHVWFACCMDVYIYTNIFRPSDRMKFGQLSAFVWSSKSRGGHCSVRQYFALLPSTKYLHMYVFVCTNKPYIHTYIHTYTHTYIHKYTHTHTYMQVCLYVCMHVCTSRAWRPSSVTFTP